ncbi:hypothetical protein [Rothia nasimurium]|uniref:hypothetical protein n=1 Tax=Rothia nasimurium TaxID=85336 RepID=UPI001F1CE606|nr:hypothetical protein [Rothia nasimurium]
MSEAKPANVQKRDTTFKQEHGAVSHLVKRKPDQAVARAIKGAQKVLDEGQGKQALNVLTLAKPVLVAGSEDAAAYYTMLATIHRAMGNEQAAQRAEQNLPAA